MQTLKLQYSASCFHTFNVSYLQVMKEVQSALNTAAADDSKLVLLSAVGSVFCCGLDFIYFIRRLTDDRKRESTKMADAIRFVKLFFPSCISDYELKTCHIFKC